MKMTTGKISGETILLDGKLALPDQTRVKVIVESIGPEFDPDIVPEISDDEVELVKSSRPRLGEITKRECE